MWWHPTLASRVEANLKWVGWHPDRLAEAADYLNRHSVLETSGEKWTPETLGDFLEGQGISPESVPDMRNLEFVVNESAWNARTILHCIERGDDEAIGQLRKAMAEDPQLRQEVIRLCSDAAEDPYQPGLYEAWLAYARQ